MFQGPEEGKCKEQTACFREKTTATESSSPDDIFKEPGSKNQKTYLRNQAA
jgi:hypothetical protein